MGDAVFEHSPMTRERAIELIEHPVMIDQATLAEASFLRRLLSPSFDTVIDMILGRQSPDSDSEVNVTSPKLSRKSYANLRSVADMDGWGDDEVLAVIDDYLDPVLMPHFAYYGKIISGNAWRRFRLRRRNSGK